MNKRLLGWLSWSRRRRHVHRPEVLRALFADLRVQAPDHVAVTGDLTNIALEQEFPAAASLLAELGPPSWVSLVPGNHDAYVPVPMSCSWDLWAEYMASDVPVAAGSDGGTLVAPAMEDFPTLRRRGPIALVGICSAMPTPPLYANGRVGADQLARLAAMLGELAAEGACRVVLIHHPVTDDGFSARRRLSDSAELREILREVGAELVLHGHGHRTQVREVEGPRGPIPIVGVRSSSHSEAREERRSTYHLFRIEPQPGARPTLSFSTRGYDAESGGFVAEGERAL
jgi:3',5'-cyclic AMP phosphodiesterase CpdA